jgi:hypothetical protein
MYTLFIRLLSSKRFLFAVLFLFLAAIWLPKVMEWLNR